MKEFGSDFHAIKDYQFPYSDKNSLFKGVWPFSDGRMGLIALIRSEGWKRLWVPEYFCYEVIASVEEMTGIEIACYQDYPLCSDDQSEVSNLPFKDGDALLRMNFFGTRGYRSNKDIPVPVIEDHSHDLTGDWAANSDADWCISSLRKTLPIAGGGIVWSPKGHAIKGDLATSDECEKMMGLRWKAMDMKADYLKGEDVSKDSFRQLYVESEEWFEKADVCGIDERSRKTVDKLDVTAWNEAKQRNWRLLNDLLGSSFFVLQPENSKCNMFSFAILANDAKDRQRIRKNLIERQVYPAILWQVPESVSKESREVSERVLSIHCDGRYEETDIRQLADIIYDAKSR